jgi:hypothetical protein
MANSSALKKVLGSLVFNKMDIPFDVEELKTGSPDYQVFLVKIKIDPNRYHMIGDKYDPSYQNFIDYFQDETDEATKYLGEDISLDYEYTFFEPRFKEILSKKIESALSSVGRLKNYRGFELVYEQNRPGTQVVIKYENISGYLKDLLLQAIYQDEDLDDFYFYFLDSLEED